MLSREENKCNFYMLSLYSKVRALPLRIDKTTGQILIKRSKAWIAFFGVVIVYLIRMIFQLIQLVVQWRVDLALVKLDHLAFHFLITLGYVFSTYWMYILFIKQSREVVLVFNELFNPVTEGFRKNNPRPLFKKKFEYSLHEFVALIFPFSVIAVTLLISAMYFSDPSRVLLLYSSVPLEYRHWTLFVALTILDTTMLIMTLATGSFCLISHMLFLQKCDSRFHSFFQQISNFEPTPCDSCAQTILKELKDFGLYINLFNRSYSSIIFSWKLLTVTFSIFCGFFSIHYYRDYPFTVVVTTYIGVMCIALSAILYDKAFEIVDSWKRVKGQLRLKAKLSKHKKYLTGGRMTEFQKKIQSIQEIGLKVGDFHIMERISTPKFIHFIVINVATLLIAFA